MKMKLKFGCAALALVMCMSLLFGCSGKSEGITLAAAQKDPVGVSMSASDKTASAIGAKFDSLGSALSALDGKLCTHTLSVSIPETADINLTAVSDPAGAFSGKLSASAMGTDLEGSLWANGTDFAISIPSLLGDKAYGVNLENLKDDLKNSDIFGEDGLLGMILEEYGTDFDSFLEALENGDESSVAPDYSAAVEKFMNAVKEATKKLEATASDGKFGDAPAIVIEYKVTEKYFEDLLNAVAEFLEDCAKSMTTEDQLDEAISELRRGFDEALDELGTGTLFLREYLNPDKGTIMAIVITDDVDTITVSLGENLTDKLNISVKVSESGEETEVLTLTETVDGTKTVYDLKVLLDGASLTAKAEYDKASGAYAISAGATSGGITMDMFAAKGKFTATKDEITFSVDSVSVYGTTVEIGFTYSVKAGGTVEKIPEYTNVFEMSEDDLADLMEKLEDSSLMGLLFMFDEDDYYGDYDWDDDIDWDDDDIDWDDIFGDMDDEALQSYLDELLNQMEA